MSVLDGPGLADDRDLDLARIGHLVLDFLGHRPGHGGGLVVRHVGRLDDDPELPSGLHGIGFLDSLEGVADPLQLLEPSHVGLEHFATRSGTGPGQRIGGIHQRRQYRLRPNLLMMGGDGVDDLRRLAVFPRQLTSDDGVGAFNLMVHGLADVVQQRRPPGLLLVEAKLGRHAAADERHLDGVQQHVLGIAVTELQPPQELDQFGVDAMDADVEHRLLSGLLDDVVYLPLATANHLLDPPRMDAAVGDERFQRHARDFAADGVVTRDDHGLGGVVDDQIDAGGRLQGADVAAFAADDPTLHLVVGEGHDRNGALGHEVAGQPRDGERDHLLGLTVGLRPCLLFHDPDAPGRIVPRLLEHLLHQALLRFLPADAGDDLEPLLGFVNETLRLHLLLADRLLLLLDGPLPIGKPGFPVLQALQPFVQDLLPGQQPPLQGLEVSPGLPDIVLELGARLEDPVFRLDLRILADRAGLPSRLLQDTLGGVPIELTLEPVLLPPDQKHADRQQTTHDQTHD